VSGHAPLFFDIAIKQTMKLTAMVRSGSKAALGTHDKVSRKFSGWAESYRERTKRGLDFSAALIILIMLSPILVLIGCLIILDDGYPIVYRHTRIGKGGRAFYCFKFRTMVRNGDQVLREHLARDPAAREEWSGSRKLQRDPRVTRLGAFLRKTSLDELPQLVNVLKGEMSLVGPRPIVAGEARLYGSKIALYKRVRPGMTGPWQIGGRSDLSYARRVEMDCEYVLGWNFQKDLYILVRTIPAVLRSSGSY